MMNLRRRYFSFVFAVALPLCGCGEPAPKFNATDITGAAFAKSFALTDHNGKARTLDDFKGKVVLISFGFTHCPDVCPATLANWMAVMQQLGDTAKDVQALFVTVDPERDTEALLKLYVPSFNPSFLGLRGTAEQTKAVAAEYKVVYQKVAGASPTTYTVDHSASSYVHDRDGRVRLLVSHGTESTKLAADIKILLAQK
jgi:protein SCO1